MECQTHWVHRSLSTPTVLSLGIKPNEIPDSSDLQVDMTSLTIEWAPFLSQKKQGQDQGEQRNADARPIQKHIHVKQLHRGQEGYHSFQGSS